MADLPTFTEEPITELAELVKEIIRPELLTPQILVMIVARLIEMARDIDNAKRREKANG